MLYWHRRPALRAESTDALVGVINTCGPTRATLRSRRTRVENQDPPIWRDALQSWFCFLFILRSINQPSTRLIVWKLWHRADVPIRESKSNKRFINPACKQQLMVATNGVHAGCVDAQPSTQSSWPVNSSVPKPIIKSSIARWPFQVSAKLLKLNRD